MGKLDTTNESQVVSPSPAGDHKAQINGRTQRHTKHKSEKTEKIHKRCIALRRSVKYFTGGLNFEPLNFTAIPRQFIMFSLISIIIHIVLFHMCPLSKSNMP